jgi:hypothetical protein
MSCPIIINGYLFRKDDFWDSLVLRDKDFDGIHLRESVVDFMKKSNIKEIELNDSFWSGVMDLDFLKKIPWIESIRIIKYGGINYQSLKLLKNLKKVVNNYSGEPIEFSSFEKLKSADILWAKGRESLLECKSLESLVLHRYKGKNLQDLRNLQNLKHIDITSSSIETIDGIDHLKNLETIEIYYNSKLLDLSLLSKCKTLKKIKLSNLSKVTNLNFLSSCKNLEFITVTECKNIIENESLFKCESLKVIGYYNSGSIATINGIEHLKYLERFNIGNTNIEDDNLEPLLRLENLTTISFKDKKHYNLRLEEVQSKLHT